LAPGQHEKSLQFALIGAHLAPPDVEEWTRLAHLSLESGDKQQAATCLKKGFSLLPFFFDKTWFTTGLPDFSW
jgi:hypothetical protein